MKLLWTLIRTLVAFIVSAGSVFGLVLSNPREFPLMLERLEDGWRAILEWVTGQLPYDESRPFVWGTVRFLSYLRTEVGGRELFTIFVMAIVLWVFFRIEDSWKYLSRPKR